MTPYQQRYFVQGQRTFRDGLARDVIDTLYAPSSEEWAAAELGYLAAREEAVAHGKVKAYPANRPARR